jgi:hypothetical protein
MLISVEEGHLSQWFAVLVIEQNKDSPKDAILLDASLKAAQHQLNILTWATARVNDPATHPELMREKHNVEEALSIVYGKHDTKQLIPLLNSMTQTANTKGEELIATFNHRYDKARRGAAFWRLVFLAAYVIGSLLIGVGVIVAWRARPSPPVA